MVTAIPVIKIAKHYAVLYTEWDGLIKGKPEYDISQHNTSNRTYNGYMSTATKRKVSQYLNCWIDAILTPKHYITRDLTTQSPYLTFVTLTLPAEQMHDDKWVKRNMLIPFISDLKRLHNVQHYFWRAEAQKNGNIHFHLLIDAKIHWELLRDLWNAYNEQHGYTSAYRTNQQAWHRNGFRLREWMLPNWSKEKQLNAYNAGTKSNWNNPNSTDIHSLKKINNVCAYVVKYCTKTKICLSPEETLEKIEIEESNRTDDEKTQLLKKFERNERPIKGRIHGCSDGLKSLKHYATEQDETTGEVLHEMYKSGQFKIIQLENAVLYCGNVMRLIRSTCPQFAARINRHTADAFEYLYCTPPPLPHTPEPIDDTAFFRITTRQTYMFNPSHN